MSNSPTRSSSGGSSSRELSVLFQKVELFVIEGDDDKPVLNQFYISEDVKQLFWGPSGSDSFRSIETANVHSFQPCFDASLSNYELRFSIKFMLIKLQLMCTDLVQFDKVSKAFKALIRLCQAVSGMSFEPVDVEILESIPRTRNATPVSSSPVPRITGLGPGSRPRNDSPYSNQDLMAISSWKTLNSLSLPQIENVQSLGQDKLQILLSSYRLENHSEDSGLSIFVDQLKNFRKQFHQFFNQALQLASVVSEAIDSHGYRETFSVFFHIYGGRGGAVGPILEPNVFEQSTRLFQNFHKILSFLVSSEVEEENCDSQKKKKLKQLFRFPSSKQKSSKSKVEDRKESERRKVDKGSRNDEIIHDVQVVKELLSFLESHLEDPSGSIVGKVPCEELLNEVSCLQTLAALIREQNRYSTHQKQEEDKNLRAIFKEMQSSSTGVPMKKRYLGFRSIDSCVSGKDLIVWIVENRSMNKTEALGLAQQLFKNGFLVASEPTSSSSSTDFRADDFFYRLQEPPPLETDGTTEFGLVSSLESGSMFRSASPMPHFDAPAFSSTRKSSTQKRKFEAFVQKPQEEARPSSPGNSCLVASPSFGGSQTNVFPEAAHLSPITCLNPNLAQFPNRLQIIKRVVEWSELLQDQSETVREKAENFLESEVSEMTRILKAEEELERVWEGRDLRLGDIVMGVIHGQGQKEQLVFCRFLQGRTGGMSVYTSPRESKKNLTLLSWKQAAPIPANWKELLQGFFLDFFLFSFYLFSFFILNKKDEKCFSSCF